MSSKAQRKKDTGSKQPIHNQTAPSFADANPDPNLDNSFNRQNSGSNLLDTSGMGDNQGFQILDGQGGSKGHFNLSVDH
jgi:hypothetical protein